MQNQVQLAVYNNVAQSSGNLSESQTRNEILIDDSYFEPNNMFSHAWGKIIAFILVSSLFTLLEMAAFGGVPFEMNKDASFHIHLLIPLSMTVIIVAVNAYVWFDLDFALLESVMPDKDTWSYFDSPRRILFGFNDESSNEELFKFSGYIILLSFYTLAIMQSVADSYPHTWTYWKIPRHARTYNHQDFLRIMGWYSFISVELLWFFPLLVGARETRQKYISRFAEYKSARQGTRLATDVDELLDSSGSMELKDYVAGSFLVGGVIAIGCIGIPSWQTITRHYYVTGSFLPEVYNFCIGLSVVQSLVYLVLLRVSWMFYYVLSSYSKALCRLGKEKMGFKTRRDLIQWWNIRVALIHYELMMDARYYIILLPVVLLPGIVVSAVFVFGFIFLRGTEEYPFPAVIALFSAVVYGLSFGFVQATFLNDQQEKHYVLLCAEKSRILQVMDMNYDDEELRESQKDLLQGIDVLLGRMVSADVKLSVDFRCFVIPLSARYRTLLIVYVSSLLLGYVLKVAGIA